MSFQVSPWPFQSLNTHGEARLPALCREDHVILRAFWVGGNDERVPASRLSRLKRLLNPAAPSVLHNSIRPDLILLIKRDSIVCGSRNGLLLTIKDLLTDRSHLDVRQHELLTRLQQKNAAKDLAIILSSELIDTYYESKHVLIPCRAIHDDSEFKVFVKKFRQNLHNERQLEFGKSSAGKSDRSCEMPQIVDSASHVKHLPLPAPPMHEHPTELTPSISIYLSSIDNADQARAFASQNLDRLSVAVTKLQQDSDKMPVPLDASPFWLSRLDSAALQRYVRELAEGLCGSVEEAFQDPRIP
eukprot:Gregarina_sp_Poly_1__9997@NODE_664_length_6888_cov_103_167424_g502_i0_p4_GENE_NODE_664_length_6888_cov_103_167424_g502_i0NODE_664_length_6888_cov_103_167424_g502_i0_p4_ORF_typecomplete_len301_score36_71_NODE_664_length_6888_cov_103_167424_g502_i01971099